MIKIEDLLGEEYFNAIYSSMVFDFLAGESVFHADIIRIALGAEKRWSILQDYSIFDFVWII